MGGQGANQSIRNNLRLKRGPQLFRKDKSKNWKRNSSEVSINSVPKSADKLEIKSNKSPIMYRRTSMSLAKRLWDWLK